MNSETHATTDNTSSHSKPAHVPNRRGRPPLSRNNSEPSYKNRQSSGRSGLRNLPNSNKQQGFLNDSSSLLLKNNSLNTFHESLQLSSQAFTHKTKNIHRPATCPKNSWFQFWNKAVQESALSATISRTKNIPLKRKRTADNTEHLVKNDHTITPKDLQINHSRSVNGASRRRGLRVKLTPQNVKLHEGKEILLEMNNYEQKKDSDIVIRVMNKSFTASQCKRIRTITASKTPRKSPIIEKKVDLDDDSYSLLSQEIQKKSKITSMEMIKNNRSKLRQLSGNVFKSEKKIESNHAPTPTRNFYDPENPHYNANCTSSVTNNMDYLKSTWPTKKALSSKHDPTSFNNTAYNLSSLPMSENNMKKSNSSISIIERNMKESLESFSSSNDVNLAHRPVASHQGMVQTILTSHSSEHMKDKEGGEKDIMSVVLEDSSFLPISKSSRANAFPPDWIVKKQKNKHYFIRSPDGNEYFTLKDGLEGLKIYREMHDKTKSAKTLRQHETDLSSNNQKYKTQPYDQNKIDYSVQDVPNSTKTPLTPLWLGHQPQHALLGSKPVWDDDYFMDEINSELLQLLMLHNRIQTLKKIKQDSQYPPSADTFKALVLPFIKKLFPDIAGEDNYGIRGQSHLDHSNNIPTRKKRYRASNHHHPSSDGAACPTSFHAHALVIPKEYGPVLSSPDHYFQLKDDEPPPQPFEVIVHPDVPFIADLHAHCAKVEIIGLLGGRWVPAKSNNETSKLFIQACLPCIAMDDGSTDVEIDPVSMTIATEALQKNGLIVVGWYHSHTNFDANPSSTDLINQSKFQTLFRNASKENAFSFVNHHTSCGSKDGRKDGKGSIEPFVGLIIRPSCAFLQKNKQDLHTKHLDDEDADLQIPQSTPKNPNRIHSELTWFHVHRAPSTYAHRSHCLARMGFLGVTLPEGQECVFAMALRITMRIRRGSLAQTLYEEERSKLSDTLRSLNSFQLLFELQATVKNDIISSIQVYDFLSIDDFVNTNIESRDAKGNSSNPKRNISIPEKRENLLSHLSTCRQKGYIGDRGLVKVEDCKVICNISGSCYNDPNFNDAFQLQSLLKSQLIKQMKSEKSNNIRISEDEKEILRSILEDHNNVPLHYLENVSKASKEYLLQLVTKVRGEYGKGSNSESGGGISLFCCEICGHTFEKPNEEKIFFNHLALHEERNEIPPLEYFDCSNTEPFIDSIKRVAAKDCSLQRKNVLVCNRFQGVYPIKGSTSFVAVSALAPIFKKDTGQLKADIAAIGTYNSDFEAALARDAHVRTQLKSNPLNESAPSAFVRALFSNALISNTLSLPEETASSNPVLNFSYDGKILMNKNPISPPPISIRRLTKGFSPYRGVTMDNTHKWRAYTGAVSIGFFRTESHSARAVNLMNLRLKSEKALLNHVSLSVSRLTAMRDGLDMDYMMQPLFGQECILESKNFDFKTWRDMKEESKTERSCIYNAESANETNQKSLQNCKDVVMFEKRFKIFKQACQDAVNDLHRRLGKQSVLLHMDIISEFDSSNSNPDSQSEHRSTSSEPRAHNAAKLFCYTCNKSVLNFDLNLTAPESMRELIEEKLERHIVHPVHCLLTSMIPSNESKGNDFDNNNSVSTNTDEARNFRICSCLQPMPGKSISTGPIIQCCGNDSCNKSGAFHLECAGGYFRSTSSNGKQKKHIEVLCSDCFEQEQNDDFTDFESLKLKVEGLRSLQNFDIISTSLKQYFGKLILPSNSSTYSNALDVISLDVTDAKQQELTGVASQIVSIIKYYCLWPHDRRTNFLASSSSGSEGNNFDTIDFCDTMRFALSIHIAKMINFANPSLDGFDCYNDVGLLDLVCRLVRFTWTISAKKC